MYNRCMAEKKWINHQPGEVQLQLWVPLELRAAAHEAAASKGMMLKFWVKQAIEEKLEREKP